jgi:23S rRNA pseudouridine955/2504/2580 synthase
VTSYQKINVQQTGIMIMNDVRYIEIQADEEGQRLDNYLIRILKGVPKSHVYRIIRGGEVRVNKKRAKPDTRLIAHDLVRIPPVRVAEAKETFVGQNLNERLMRSIIYEDERFLVVNKPSGLAVHGGSGLSLGLIEGFRKIRDDLPYLELVHRLDKETSGCLLLAKKRSVLRALQALFESREIQKTYWALLAHPWVGKATAIVDVALEKNTLVSGERMVRVHAEGKASQTTFRLLENFHDTCFVSAMPKTGRTHQIRVHSAHLGHPILGDDKYGESGLELNLSAIKKRLYLHARAIQFNLYGKDFAFVADLDHHFEQALGCLRAQI